MAAVTGPISSLPNSRHELSQNTKCDSHPDRNAVARVQGETDSFGSEMNDLCSECLSNHKSYLLEARVGVCDWCKNQAADLRDTRDYEEGMSGPVYRVCGKCKQKEYEALEEAFEEY